MKLILKKDGSIVERRVGAAFTGIRLSAYQLNLRDLEALHRLSPEKLHAYITTMMGRLVPDECCE